MSNELQASPITDQFSARTSEAVTKAQATNGLSQSTADMDNGLNSSSFDDLAAHPYAAASRLDEELHRQRAVAKGVSDITDEVEFSALMGTKGGKFTGLHKLQESGGALEHVILSNLTRGYCLTIGTCGQFAPAWISKKHHNRPMWVMHCPDLPTSHIDGGAFFEGLSSSWLGTRSYTREDDCVGISYLIWDLAKRDEILAKVDPELLESLLDADGREGSVVIAYVGYESFTVTRAHIPAGLTEFLVGYEMQFAKMRLSTCEKDIAIVEQAERSITDELTNSSNVSAICSVSKWSPKKNRTYET